MSALRLLNGVVVGFNPDKLKPGDVLVWDGSAIVAQEKPKSKKKSKKEDK